MDKPIYKITIDNQESSEGEHLGCSKIAYTASPAILTKGMAFAETEVKKMRFSDSSKLRVVAPIMIPMHIYQVFDDGECFVQFEKEGIEKIFVDFQDRKDKGLIKSAFNIDHDNSQTPPSFILESWMVGKDPKADRSWSEFGIEVPAGTVMVVSQFRDKEYFENEIVAKGRTGYSIEGFLGMELSRKIKNNITNKIMEKKTKFSAKYLEDGTPIWIDDATKEVYTVDENMDKVPLFDGEHKLADGTVIATVDGKITEEKKEVAESKDEPVIEPVAEVKASIVAEPEVKLAEEPVVDVVTPEVVAPSVDEAAILKVVQPVIDELIKKIAELSAKIDEDVASEEVVMKENKLSQVKMTMADKLKFIQEFNS